jgi:hypothetical protein
MYREAKVLPNTFGSTVAFLMFRETIGKLVQVTFCVSFFFFFLKIFLYLRHKICYREAVASTLNNYPFSSHENG